MPQHEDENRAVLFMHRRKASRNALILHAISQLRRLSTASLTPNSTQQNQLLLLLASETYTLHVSTEQSMTSVLPSIRENLQHDTRITQPFCRAERRAKRDPPFQPRSSHNYCLLFKPHPSSTRSLTSRPSITHLREWLLGTETGKAGLLPARHI